MNRRRFLAGAAGMLVAGVRSLRAAASTRTVELICRDAWGAREPTGSFDRHRIKRLTVHHSASVLRDNREAPARLRSHQRNHQSRGWPDIAYHVLIDRHGNVYEGRPIRTVGDTATNYDPRGHFLVMCEGNFSEQRPAGPQVESLADVLAWAAERYDVSPRKIAGHLEYADTACPGRSLQRLIRRGEIRDLVRSRIREGGVGLVELCGDEGRERVEDIEAGRA
ncbi:MAG: peptidoglycan recognition protein family protein [Actinomycetota bacterium]|nr:peptidoglycan recognition protein family protein [Actinomycetota bacterium]